MNCRVAASAAYFALVSLMSSIPALAVPTMVSTLDTAAIERLTGVKGRLDKAEGVFKVSVPRSDLAVTVAGAKVTPPLGLTSWAAFMPAGKQAMLMGDLVLTEDQVNPNAHE